MCIHACDQTGNERKREKGGGKGEVHKYHRTGLSFCVVRLVKTSVGRSGVRGVGVCTGLGSHSTEGRGVREGEKRTAGEQKKRKKDLKVLMNDDATCVCARA